MSKMMSRSLALWCGAVLIAVHFWDNAVLRSRSVPFRSHVKASDATGFLVKGRSSLLRIAVMEKKENHILYRTAPVPDGEEKSIAQEEEEKKEKSWDMLRNTVIEIERPRPRRPHVPPEFIPDTPSGRDLPGAR